MSAVGCSRERSKRQLANGQAGRSRIHFQGTALAGQHSADFWASTHRGALSAHLFCLELWPPARDSGSSQPLLNGRCGGLARVQHESRGWTLKHEISLNYTPNFSTPHRRDTRTPGHCCSIILGAAVSVQRDTDQSSSELSFFPWLLKV